MIMYEPPPGPVGEPLFRHAMKKAKDIWGFLSFPPNVAQATAFRKCGRYNSYMYVYVSQKIHVGGRRIMYIEMIVSSGRLQAPEPCCPG